MVDLEHQHSCVISDQLRLQPIFGVTHLVY